MTAFTCLADDFGDDDIDDDHDVVSERTARLDRLADEDMPMLHAREVPPKHDTAPSSLGESVGADAETGSLAQLGASAGEQAELQADVQEATAETEGMFDADIRAARAFASFDNKMDSLKHSISDLDAKTKMRQAVEKPKETEDSELGEGGKSVLDEDKEDLLGDVDIQVHVDDTPDSEEKADKLLRRMGAHSTDKKSSAIRQENNLGETDDTGKGTDEDDDEEEEEEDNSDSDDLLDLAESFVEEAEDRGQ
jgi:hypothetical protein